jgi:hypothetical protein
MKTDFHVSLRSSWNDKFFQTKIVEKITTHILCSINFFSFENRTFYEIMWKNILQANGWQYGACALHAGCLRLQTRTEYVTLTPYPQQKWLPKRSSLLRYTSIACLVWHSTISLFTAYMQLRTRWRERINRVKRLLLFIWYPCLLVSTIFFILSERLAVFFFTNSYNFLPSFYPHFLLLPLRERAWNPSDFLSCRLALTRDLCCIHGLQIITVTCIFL